MASHTTRNRQSRALRTCLGMVGLIAAGMVIATPAAAQTDSNGDAIVVTAQRAGAPMWTIDTPTGAVILVGEIRAVPKSTPWQPDRLQEALARADRVILRAPPRFSPGDVLRLIFAGGRVTRLPDNTVAADYLAADQRARLAALEARYDVDYDRRSFLMTAFDLLARRLDFDDDTTDDATDVVRKAADRADVPIHRPDRFRGEDLLDNLAAAEPTSHIACLDAAMTATEAGRGIIEARAADWHRSDVAGVMANPLEVALGTCWPWADDELGAEIRERWTGMVADAADDPGVTLAVVPLRVLAEQGGVLDRLQARGFVISGPDWH